MNITGLLVNKKDEYFMGYYYKKYPKNSKDGRMRFRYSKTSNKAKSFNTVGETMRADNETYNIRTNDDCGFVIGGYVSTQDGTFWQITEINHDEQVKGNEQATLWFKKAVETNYILALIKVENPYDYGEN